VGQGDVFRKEVESIIPQALNGYNTSVFCYGATGAGKTFTMQGNASKPGIIPRVAKRLMDTVNARGGFKVSVSYLEIYNERVKDLLDPKDADMPIRQDIHGNIVVHNLSEMSLGAYEDFKPAWIQGCKNRTTAPTGQNKLSSRSHSVLMFKVGVWAVMFLCVCVCVCVCVLVCLSLFGV
jgi:kinesin family member 22